MKILSIHFLFHFRSVYTRKLAPTSATHNLSLNALLYIPERNDLKCIIRSHAEVKSGCGLSHANCYTVFSAPFEEKGIMGGLIELRGDTLNLQGNVFKVELVSKELNHVRVIAGLFLADWGS